MAATEDEISSKSEPTLGGQIIALTCWLICSIVGVLVLNWAWSSPDDSNASVDSVAQHIIAIVVTGIGSLAAVMGVINSIGCAVQLVNLLARKSRGGDVQ